MRRAVNRPPSDIAVVLADMPDVVAALIRDHVPDARGRCRACGTPGTGTPHLPWPCPLRRIADAARKLRAGGRR
jgi:hypothetical protein